MAKTMNCYVQTLYDQIGQMAFFMMGARNMAFDNEKNALHWKIDNSTISSIRVDYDLGLDLYQVCFFSETKNTVSEIVIEQVDVYELHATIERVTALRLSLKRVYAQ